MPNDAEAAALENDALVGRQSRSPVVLGAFAGWAMPTKRKFIGGRCPTYAMLAETPLD